MSKMVDDDDDDDDDISTVSTIRTTTQKRLKNHKFIVPTSEGAALVLLKFFLTVR